MAVSISEPQVAPIGAVDRRNAALCAALLGLNNDYARELSLLDAARFDDLCRMAFAAWHIGEAALLLAFDQDARYDSENFLHLRRRFDRFVYIDRVVVAAAARGLGHAARLYARLEDAARAAGHRRLVCEVNIDPPNPGSDRFHAARGFLPIGEAQLGNGKRVGYLCRPLDAQPASTAASSSAAAR